MGGVAYSVKDGVWIAAPDITLKSRSGSWSNSELKRAITRGVRPDGSRLSGVMPFDAFDQITESDQDAVVSFIRSLKSQ